MAREKAPLARGDAFPELELSLSTGERILFPGGSGGKWTALLLYCGNGCSTCLEQLDSFRRSMRESRRENMRALAISGEDRERTIRTIWSLQIPFPVAYLEGDARMRNGLLRAVYDGEREDMHPRVYLVDPEGKIASAFSGRLPADWLHPVRQPAKDGRGARERPGEAGDRYAVGGPVRRLTRL